MIPTDEMDTILDNIGLPNSGINLAFGDNPVLGNSDGDIQVSLKPKHHPAGRLHRADCARGCTDSFPTVSFNFESANITNQILNFGLPAPIDLQVVGRDFTATTKSPKNWRRRSRGIPGAADVHVHQIVDYPEVRVNVDRSKADQVGLTRTT